MGRQVLNMLVAAILILIGTSCTNSNNELSKKKRFVKVVKLTNAKENNQIVFNGVLKEKQDVNVAFKVGGQVLELLADEGDYVKEGQVIAKIDKRDYKIHLHASEAQYNQIDAEYSRYKELYSQKKLPANTLEKLEAGYLAAKSGYEAAQNALNDTELKAPFAGYVYRKKINNFENVAPGQVIFTLLDVSCLEVGFGLPESQVNRAKKFSEIVVDVASANAYNVPAELLSVNEKANGNDMFDVRLIVNNTDGNILKPGMSAKVRIKIPQEELNSITVPVESVFESENKTYVWVFNSADSVVIKTPVEVEKFKNNGLLLVTSGLKGNENVVTAGVHSLSDKQAVKLLNNKKL